MAFFDEEEDEGESTSALDKQIERDQRERERFMDSSGASDLYEIPEKLEPREAIWYYNVMDDRREEVYQMHFARLSRLEDWLEVYTNAKEETPARELAFSKLAGLTLDYRGYIELYEARYNDERIVDLATARLDALCGRTFERWLEVYDYAPYGSKIQQMAGRKLKVLAEDIHHWQALYDRSDIGSPQQVNALQQILLLSRFDQIQRTNRDEEEFKMLAHAASKGPKEWRQEYEKNDLYSPASEMAVLNIYISADIGQSEEIKQTAPPSQGAA